jgi:hypothetical protein
MFNSLSLQHDLILVFELANQTLEMSGPNAIVYRRLVVRLKHLSRGMQTCFGIIATNVPEQIEHVEAEANFSITDSLGQDLVMGEKFRLECL